MCEHINLSHFFFLVNIFISTCFATQYGCPTPQKNPPSNRQGRCIPCSLWPFPRHILATASYPPCPSRGRSFPPYPVLCSLLTRLAGKHISASLCLHIHTTYLKSCLKDEWVWEPRVLNLVSVPCCHSSEKAFRLWVSSFTWTTQNRSVCHEQAYIWPHNRSGVTTRPGPVIGHPPLHAMHVAVILIANSAHTGGTSGPAHQVAHSQAKLWPPIERAYQ